MDEKNLTKEKSPETSPAAATAVEEDDDWSLNSGQMLFMLRHNNLFQDATNDDDIEQVRALAASDEYKTLFGAMGIDEAYDRYLTALEEGRA